MQINNFTKKIFNNLSYPDSIVPVSTGSRFSPLTIARAMQQLRSHIKENTLTKHQLSFLLKFNAVKSLQKNNNVCYTEDLKKTTQMFTSKTTISLKNSKTKILSAFNITDVKWELPMVEISGLFKSSEGIINDHFEMICNSIPEKCNYYEDTDVKIVEKPFVGNMVMGIILPKDNKHITLTNLDKYSLAFEKKYVKIEMPKFNNIFHAYGCSRPDSEPFVLGETLVYDSCKNKFAFSDVNFQKTFKDLGIVSIFHHDNYSESEFIKNDEIVENIEHQTFLNLDGKGLNITDS